MAAKLGDNQEQTVAELVRAIVQELADGVAPDKVKESLAKRGLPRDQASHLVDAGTQARNRHDNSATGRAAATFLSMGSGGGTIFYGAVLVGAYFSSTV